jgi:hypothetical protein
MNLVDRWLPRSFQSARTATPATCATFSGKSFVSADFAVTTDLRHDATLSRAPTPSPLMSRPVANGLRHESPQDSAVLAPLSQMSQRPAARAANFDPAGAEKWGQAEEKGSACRQPMFLSDGRRLHRFRAETIPVSASHQVRALPDQASWYGAVLVADGHDLIVVERWRSALPLETLRALKEAAGAIIAYLRGESRARCTPQERGLHNE